MSITATLMLISLLGVGKDMPEGFNSPAPNIIPITTLSTRSITLGTTRTKVISNLGQPVKSNVKVPGNPGDRSIEIYEFDSLTIEFNQGSKISPLPEPHVVRILILGSKWATKCGIRVGSPASAVVKMLGKPNEIIEGSPESLKSRNDIDSYYHYFASPGDSAIFISMKRGVVTAIEICGDLDSP